MTRPWTGLAGRLLRLGSIGTLVACSAVYPEIKPPIRPPPAGQELTPPPPDDLLFITFKGATIPRKTRDGRQWDSVGGDAPDPFARLMVDDREIVKTPTQQNTLKPTWPDQKRANYRIPRRATIRVELWNNNAINDDPICYAGVRHLHEEANVGTLEVRCNSGARVVLGVEPAHAKLGLGFFYEIGSGKVRVSRVLTHGPAAREGIERGDHIVEIQGKPVEALDADEVRSLINANASIGVKLRLEGKSGESREIVLRNGPIYPVSGEPIDVK